MKSVLVVSKRRLRAWVGLQPRAAHLAAKRAIMGGGGAVAVDATGWEGGVDRAKVHVASFCAKVQAMKRHECRDGRAAERVQRVRRRRRRQAQKLWGRGLGRLSFSSVCYCDLVLRFLKKSIPEKSSTHNDCGGMRVCHMSQPVHLHHFHISNRSAASKTSF